ncbi:MAG: gliding motility protein GldL, partial [Porphyromonadaceae bacterium]|nr:gliding motility protein GldL [Porphyromonadaceae bacterium]
QKYLDQMGAISEQMTQFRQATQSLTDVSNVLLDSYRSITDNSGGISNNTQGYVEQMETLNRNISGLNTIYEIQLKSISSQLDNIDRVNAGLRNIREMYEGSMHDSSRYCEEVEKMTRYMAQLNAVYSNMLTAMTVNMYNRPTQPVEPLQPQRPAAPESSDENA